MAGMYDLPTVDFSTLGKLGDIYQQGKIGGARERTLASLAQGAGAADVARALAGAGDIEGAKQ